MTDMERTTLHIVGGDSRSRAEQARIAFALGHHAEVYGDLGELIERPPDEGLILAADEDLAVPARMLVDRLSASGIWLPMMLAAHEPTVERAVEVIKAGALDYLALPLEMGSFARRLGSILGEAETFTRRRRREIEARHAIEQLSRREREVLELLSEGCSNKEIWAPAMPPMPCAYGWMGARMGPWLPTRRKGLRCPAAKRASRAASANRTAPCRRASGAFSGNSCALR